MEVCHPGASHGRAKEADTAEDGAAGALRSLRALASRRALTRPGALEALQDVERVLESVEATAETKALPRAEKGRLNRCALKREIEGRAEGDSADETAGGVSGGPAAGAVPLRLGQLLRSLPKLRWTGPGEGVQARERATLEPLACTMNSCASGNTLLAQRIRTMGADG
jgi:hypothetical protein